VGDEKREPDWVFKLTSGVAARLFPLSLLAFAAVIAGYSALMAALKTNPPLPSLVVIAMLFVGVLVLHEGLHGLGFAVFGGRPKFGLMIRGGIPYAYATCPGRVFTRTQYLVIGALPLVVIDVAVLPLAGFPAAAMDGMLAAAFNTAGAVGDLWMLALVLQTPRGTRFLDPDGTSMAALLPAGAAGRKPKGLDPRGYEWVVVWLVATVLAFTPVLFAALQLALGLNGGAGGQLWLGPILIAEASHAGGHAQGGVKILPAVGVAAVIGLAVAAAWAVIAGTRRRSV
jgi:hypothetical protein